MMQLIIAILILALAATGCTTSANARAEAQKAYLAGENDAMHRMQTPGMQITGITVLGSVQNTYVAWVAGITVAQAIATANYVGPQPPSEIIINSQGQETVINASDLDRAAQTTLQPGDIITLRQ